MNLKLYQQFSDAYQQCIRVAFEDSHIPGEIKVVARGLPTEGITILFGREGGYCPVIPMREAFVRAEMFDTWQEELADRAMEVFSNAETEHLRIAIGQLEQPEYVGIYAANHKNDLDALKYNDMPYLVMGDMVFYYLFYASLGDGRYYQAEVTNKHLESWKMRKREFHNFVLEHSLVSMETQMYPLCEKIGNLLEGITCCLNIGEAEDSLGYVVTGPGGVASVLYWDTLQELSRLMSGSFFILPYSEREAFILPDTIGGLSSAFSIEDIHKNGNHQVRRSLAGYAVSSHGYHYAPKEQRGKRLQTIGEWKKAVNEE